MTNDTGPIAPEQRFTAGNLCPICQGHKDLPQHQGIRCYGYRSSNGEGVVCTQVRSDRPAGESGGWWHRVDENGHLDEDDDWVTHLLAQQDHAGSGTIAYTYRDADGTVLRTKYRFADGTKKWAKRGSKVKVPYRLPELIAERDGAHVYVVDGERDVEALRTVGVCATCGPDGMSRWQQEYSDHLRGASKVTIVQDKDSAGPAQAQRVKAMTGHIEVEIVEAAAGKDAYDHIAAGYALDDFVLVPSRFEMVDLASYEPLPVEWLHEPILLASTHTSIVASTGSGNTMLSLILVRSVVRAGETVVYLDQENGSDVIKERMTTLQYSDDEMRLVKYCPYPSATQDEFAALVAEVTQHSPTLVVLDPKINFLSAAELDEDKAKDTTVFHTSVVVPLKRTGAAVLEFDHLGHKGERPRGSSAKSGHAEAEWTFSVEEPFDKNRTTTATLKRGPKNRRSSLPPYLVFTMGGDGKDGFIFRSREATMLHDEVARWKDLLKLTEALLGENAPDSGHALGADKIGTRLREAGQTFDQIEFRGHLKSWADGLSSRITAKGKRGGYYYPKEEQQ